MIQPLPMTVVIPTLGRSTLSRLIDSLAPAMLPMDRVIIIADAVPQVKWDFIESMGLKLKHTGCMIVRNTSRSGHYGHLIRTYYQRITSRGGLVYHPCDDDTLNTDQFIAARSIARTEGKLYLCAGSDKFGKEFTPELKEYEVSGQLGFVPAIREELPVWDTKDYLADFRFYRNLARIVPVVYLKQNIVTITHSKGSETASS